MCVVFVSGANNDLNGMEDACVEPTLLRLLCEILGSIHTFKEGKICDQQCMQGPNTLPCHTFASFLQLFSDLSAVSLNTVATHVAEESQPSSDAIANQTILR